ncbi:DUF4395 domain-containing protein [Kineosporia sp. A_224]|uniref:DUF4395 domain-containing protein n=1 Tax=Kineosporia sp. A_224 TaxID=1962180 RepID=UPI00117B5D95|nr:DUF4395 domain-containing protein [Kineosporia sp. A_224]
MQPTIAVRPSSLVDERTVRAAAGLTLVLGAVAFFEALLAKDYLPLRIVTAFFALDFALRVAAGPQRSPVGAVAGLLVRRLPPEPVSLRPKRFAWSLGLGMSVAMTGITNAGVTGWLPRGICLLCLTLMWLEAVLGVCLGCQVHRLLVARGIAAQDPALVCADGACDLSPGRPGRS